MPWRPSPVNIFCAEASAMTGAFGNAVPKMLQQFAVEQVAICVVTYTPVSSATYIVFASFGSNISAFAGASGRFALTFSQCAPKSVERYTCGDEVNALPNPMIVAYTVAPVRSCGSTVTEETSKPNGLKTCPS